MRCVSLLFGLVFASFLAGTLAQVYVQQTYYHGSGCSGNVGAIEMAQTSCWADAAEYYSCQQSTGGYSRYACDDDACGVCELSETVQPICEAFPARTTDSVIKRCQQEPPAYPNGAVIQSVYPQANCGGDWGRRLVLTPNFCYGGIKASCSGGVISYTACTDSVNCATGCNTITFQAGCMGDGKWECVGDSVQAPSSTGSSPVAEPPVDISPPMASTAPEATPVSSPKAAAPASAPFTSAAPTGSAAPSAPVPSPNPVGSPSPKNAPSPTNTQTPVATSSPRQASVSSTLTACLGLILVSILITIIRV